MGFTVTLIAGLHVLCCGLLLPLMTGVSVATMFQSWPALAVTGGLLGFAALAWYARRGRAACPDNPDSCRVETRPDSK